jgi:SAM-dependent methyltransferase
MLARHVTPEERSRLTGMVDAACTGSPELELEARVTEPLDLQSFKRVVQSLRALAQKRSLPPPLPIEDSSLDILGERVRATVQGTKLTRAFLEVPACRGHTPLTYLRKEREQPPLDMAEYGLRWNLKRETPLAENVVDPVKFLTSKSLTLRLKRRVSLSLPGLFCRVDMTVVRMAEGMALSEGLQHLRSSPEVFEVEVEFDAASARLVPDSSRLLDGILDACGAVLCGVLVCLRVVPRTVAVGVLDEYGRHAEAMSPGIGKRLLGPQLVTLTRAQLQCQGQSAKGVCVLSQGQYTVTEKADGARSILFVSERDSNVYVISDTLRIWDTGLQDSGPEGSTGACILDCEHMAVSNQVAVFDAYLVDGGKVAQLPLMSPAGGGRSRLLLARAVVARLQPRDSEADPPAAKVFVKQFRFSGDLRGMMLQCREVLQEAKSGVLPYATDGLIFTPAALPVGALFPGDAEPRLTRRWASAYKWKPAERNSIDFLVHRVPGASMWEGRYCAQFRLLVGANLSPLTGQPVDVPLEPLDILLRRFEAFKSRGGPRDKGRYGVVPFRPLPLSAQRNGVDPGLLRVELDDRGRALCNNGELLEDSLVVECGWRRSGTLGGRWEAHLVRHDKTERMRATGSGPNDIGTAMSVWGSIQEPVTEAMLVGDEPCPPPAGGDELNSDYYMHQAGERDSSVSLHMRTFHNHIKQSRLVGAASRMHARSVCEMACGRGGDLSKWISSGVTRLLGLDLFPSNLYHPSEGAYARLANHLLGLAPDDRSTLHYVFLPMDLRMPIEKSVAGLSSRKTTDALASQEKRISQVVWGTVPSSSVAEVQLRPYYGMAPDRFDVVSCQFSVHYFFADLPTLKTFVANVASCLRPGGLFVGTCLDGFAVDQLFRRRGDEVSESLSGRLVWYIKKGYEGHLSPTEPVANIGKQIDVYMETFVRPMPEFLVDFSLLRQELSRLGIRTPEAAVLQELGLQSPTAMFDAEFGALRTDDATPRKLDTIRRMTPPERSYSFLNRWFVFQKDSRDNSSE